MPLTGNQAHPAQRQRGSVQRRRGLWIAAAALVLAGLAAAGCASTPEKPKLTLTGDILVDGPNAVATGPQKDRVLWAYRTAAAAMRRGQYDVARRMLDEAILTMGGILARDKSAKESRGYFNAESKKTFIGEPYERCMAYIYRGILYWMDGEPDNARACFRSAQLIDSDTQNKAYSGDWVLADYLDGLITARLGGDGTDALKRAQQAAKGIKLPPFNREANVLIFLEFGPGPTKYSSGEYGEQLKFTTPSAVVNAAEVKIDGMSFPVAPTDDVAFQATTRGGRVMDHILGNKAVFKTTTDAIGTAALIGGLGTAAISHDSTAQGVGLGIAAAGLIGKVISAATTPQADTRMWDNLPRHLSFAALSLPPGEHTATVEFRDPAGNPIPRLTKTVNLRVPPTGDKVAFIGDQSITPQTI